jgi:predicted glutamine amidotransferase
MAALCRLWHAPTLMCRLFGFRSVIPSQVHRSLLAAENALGVQSNEHPDGWGVAFYVDGAPHITRSPLTALGDQLFHRLSGVVSSETVLAHVRRATRGGKTVLNCHPFQYGRWVFAHNGDIPTFDKHREALLSEVAPRLRRFILGDTDSETVFFIFLTRLSAYGPLSRQHAVEDVVAALGATLARVREICDEPGSEPCVLTVIVTDGDTLVATQGGKELYWSSYKTRCSDRETCPSLSRECEAPSATGFVNHLILSSEPLQGENIWAPLELGDVIGVDYRMRVTRTRFDRRVLPVVQM